MYCTLTKDYVPIDSVGRYENQLTSLCDQMMEVDAQKGAKL